MLHEALRVKGNSPCHINSFSSIGLGGGLGGGGAGVGAGGGGSGGGNMSGADKLSDHTNNTNSTGMSGYPGGPGTSSAMLARAMGGLLSQVQETMGE